MPKPSIGRIVIYKVSDQSVQSHPAIITAVHDPETVNLMVFFDAIGPSPCTSVKHGSVSAEGQSRWDWPTIQN